jgi:hypothetical protein
MTFVIIGIVKMGSVSRSFTLCGIIGEEIMDELTAIECGVECGDGFLDSESELNHTITVEHTETGGGEIAQSSARKCRQSLGTMYCWSDSAMSPTVCKFDNVILEF